MFKLGIHHGVEMDAYRADTGIASSDLSALKRSPAYAQLRRTTVNEATPAMLFGTAVHTAVLEPDLFSRIYDEDPQHPEQGGYPRGWRNSKAYREAVAAVHDNGKTPLSAIHMHACEQIRRNVLSHSTGKLISDTQDGAEVSVFGQDEDDIRRKIRPDMLISKASMIVDLKTTNDPTAFRRTVNKFGYHRSAAYYLDTIGLLDEVYDHYLFLVVATDPPYEVSAYTLDDDSIEQGRYEYKTLLREYAACMESGNWPLPDTGIEEVRLPEYAINYHEEMEEEIAA
jgi:hypothetical protein